MIPHTLTPALDYIDPGTGSMLFALLIGLVGVAQFGLKGLLIKAKFRLSGGRDEGHAADALPLVIFSDHKRYWKNFDPVCRELDRRGIDVTYLTASPDDPVLEGPYPHVHGEFIGEGNRAFARMNLLNATMVLATTPGLHTATIRVTSDNGGEASFQVSGAVMKSGMTTVGFDDDALPARWTQGSTEWTFVEGAARGVMLWNVYATMTTPRLSFAEGDFLVVIGEDWKN
jgi:hypothetical protein